MADQINPSQSNPQPASTPSAVNQYEQERRTKRDKLKALGLDPHGQRTEGMQPLADIRALFKTEFGQDGGPVVKAAGRIVLKRDMGKLTFMTIRDESGDMQVALDKKRLPELDWQVNDLLDLGDLVVVQGPLGATKKGETTIWAKSLAIASKALLPPPAKWEGLSDVETRYRQRYVDLWANPDVMKTLKLRMRIVDEIRQFMRDRGFLEVETPMMQTLHGGAAARPFVTHHNALDIQLYMRIAPELYLKRLLVGGFTKVFELNRNFRNEGISPRHNPEFTMLEAYEAFGSWETMAELVESLICHVAEKVCGTLKIVQRRKSANPLPPSPGTPGEGRSEGSSPGANPATTSASSAEPSPQPSLGVPGEGEKIINLEGDLSKPKGQRWRRVSMADLVEERTGWKFDGRPFSAADASVQRDVRMLAARAAMAVHVAGRQISGLFYKGDAAYEKSVEHLATNELAVPLLPLLHDRVEPAEQLVAVYEKLIEPTLIDPCFVTHVPSVIIPLAKKNAADPFFADVYELAINGQEISPGYTELNDPDVQEANFKHQVGDKEEQQKTDDDFLNALRYGMPPAGGLGLGIDRLVMMLTGAESIRDVILFPLMKPQE